MSLTTKNFRRLLVTPGRYRDTGGEVKGLLLVVVNERNASWQLRYERAGKERCGPWLSAADRRERGPDSCAGCANAIAGRPRPVGGQAAAEGGRTRGGAQDDDL